MLAVLYIDGMRCRTYQKYHICQTLYDVQHILCPQQYSSKSHLQNDCTMRCYINRFHLKTSTGSLDILQDNKTEVLWKVS